jgi:hypothetical protein
MGQNNMGLPGGANDWAREVSKALETLAQLQEMARRICSDFGLDIANPGRGLYTGATPSVDNPVQLKLPSLQDLDIRDAQDGDLLTFDGKRGKWVARAHDTVQLPKEFPLGDPASYYVPDPEAGFLPADTWGWFRTYTNVITDPRFENSTGNWAWDDSRNNVPSTAVASLSSGGRGGGSCMRVDYYNGVTIIPESGVTIMSFGNLLTAHTYRVWVMTYDTGIAVDAYFDFVYDGYRQTNYQDRVYLEPGVWQQLQVTGSGGDDGFYGPQLDTALALGVTLPSLGSATIYVDDLLVSGDMMNWTLGSWNGATPDDPDYSYSWTGEPDASTSTAVQNRRIQVPSTAPIGSVVQVIGQSFTPGETVDLYVGGDMLNTINAESDGTFDARLTIPADAFVSEFNSISALGESGVYPSADINITAAE